MKYTLTLCLVACSLTTTIFSQNQVTTSQDDKRIDSLIVNLQGLRYNNDIKNAGKALENYQAQVIPKIIKLLYSEKRLDSDPGDPYTYLATANFEGQSKGDIIPYNFDWLSIRAGWLIEKITFIDFGYSSKLNIKDKDYGFYKGTWNKIATAKSLMVDRKILADKVAAWWQKNKATWTRFGALKTALQSNDKAYSARAIAFISYGQTKCDGFTKEAIDKELKPLLVHILANTKDQEVKDQINNILKSGPSDDLLPIVQEESTVAKEPTIHKEPKLLVNPDTTKIKKGFIFPLPVTRPKDN